MKRQEMQQLIHELVKVVMEEGYKAGIDDIIEKIVREIENDEAKTVDDCDNFIWFMGYKQGLQTARRIVENSKPGKENE